MWDRKYKLKVMGAWNIVEHIIHNRYTPKSVNGESTTKY